MVAVSPRIPLFDLGNVVIEVNFAPFVGWLAERSGNPAEAARVLGTSLFFDYEFGRITRAQFASRLADLYGGNFSLSDVEERFCAIFPGPVSGIEELLHELAGEGEIYALSNTNELHLEWLNRYHGALMGKFTKIFASHELGARKPDPGIYLQVARSLAVPPASLVFFDDLPANVEGARRAGLEAHLFTETGQARQILKRNS
jgi:FMN phosphatase YigB (HAD superfamily)